MGKVHVGRHLPDVPRSFSVWQPGSASPEEGGNLGWLPLEPTSLGRSNSDSQCSTSSKPRAPCTQ